MTQVLLLSLLVSASPAKVVIIGLDGVSLNVLVPMAEKGVAPNLGKLLKEGVRGDLDVLWPLRTPQVWTSAVTGKLPWQHGIWDHKSNTYFNPPEIRTKKPQRVTSKQRKSKALWNLLDAAQIKSLTVGWMASWPAESLKHGTMVAPIELIKDPRQTTIKGSFFRDAPELVSPAALDRELDRWIVEPYDIKDEELTGFADVPPADSPLNELPRMERYLYALKWSLARARSVERITSELAKKQDYDVVSLYMQCTDSLMHRFWIFSEGEAETRERFTTHGIETTHVPELVRRFKGVVEACYRDVDARVGRLLEQLRGPDTLVIVLSDHGFGSATKPHRLKGEPYSGDHLDQGIIIAAGPGIKKGKRVDGVNIMDLAPTVLAAMGLPAAKDMRGRVATQLWSAPPALKPSVPTYESAPQLEAKYVDGYPERRIGPRPVPRPSQDFFSR
ncbi:MAG: alkaline phosphatase family protein [Myxococcota bacterium]